MSFDLKNTLQIFQRRTDNILKDLNYCCLVYTDDVLVFSKTIEQPKDDVLATMQGALVMLLSLVRTSVFLLSRGDDGADTDWV